MTHLWRQVAAQRTQVRVKSMPFLLRQKAARRPCQAVQEQALVVNSAGGFCINGPASSDTDIAFLLP